MLNPTTEQTQADVPETSNTPETQPLTFALCTARIQNPEILESINALVREAHSRGYRMLVFNSSLNSTQNQNDTTGCVSYELIPFPMTNMLILMSDTINNPMVCSTLLAMAKEHHIPVMNFDGRLEGVPSVCSYANQAFDEILDHVFTVHGCRRVDLLTGSRGNIGSEHMVLDYREALRKHDIPFEEERVAYGEYWEEPAISATEQLLMFDTPEAIVAANDEMALAACAVLRKHGLHIPEDVIVTGSDGIVKERCFTPRLTTSTKDYPRMCAALFDTAELLLDGETVDELTEVAPLLRISESCGCCVTEERDQNEYLRLLFKTIRINQYQESEEHWILGSMMKRRQPTVIDYLDVMCTHLPENACLCLRDSLSPEISEHSLQQFSDPSELMSTVLHKKRDKQFALISRSQLIPDLENILASGKAVYINAVYMQNEVYGYYAYYGTDLEQESIRLPKFIHTAGNVIGSTLATSRLQAMNEKLVAARIRDSLTGMLNLHGAMRTLTERIRGKGENDHLIMVVVGLNRLRQINSIFGRNEGDQALLSLAGAITDSIDCDAVAARVGGDEFMIGLFRSELSMNTAETLISVIKKRLDSYNQVSGKSYTLEISVGIMTTPIHDGISLDAMLNEAITKKDAQKLGKNENGSKSAISDAQKAQMERILNENLLTYYFQPIVSAKNGQIYAYEALMRTTGGFRISPLTVLAYATAADRLYEIEWLTYNNVLKALREQLHSFEGRRVFINSIPGHFLTDADFNKLTEVYSDILPKLVVEFTEQAETEGEELEQIQERCRRNHMDIAVDDYGTGYSNIANLLRYSPNCVKIDRSLISNIQEEPKKQHFVNNIIEFAHSNGFMALAEGVETAEELRAVIRFGVDLIQGNFTSVPNPTPLESIPDRIVAMICKFSASAAKQVMQKTYMAAGEPTININQLENEHYTDLFVAQEELEITSTFGESTGVHIKIKDDTNCRIVIQDAHFKANQQSPAIVLGRNCNVTLDFRGINRMDTGGIMVPESSTLNITGKGNLTIRADDNKACAIGNDSEYACGAISIDLAGILTIISNGNLCIGIGSGLGKNQKIEITGTQLFMEMSGRCGVGIGTIDGEADITLSGCSVDYDLRMAASVALGSMEGCPTLRVNTASINVKGSGTNLCAIGSASGGCDLMIKDSSLCFELTGQSIIAVGSTDSAPTIGLRACDVYLRAEGTHAMDFGAFDESASLTVIDSDLDLTIQSAKAQHFAAVAGQCIISGGKNEVKINQ